MPIIRRKKTDNFTTISNELLRDQRLSYEARGMLAELLSRPDNWQLSVTQLRKSGNLGREKIARMLKEIEQAGYIRRQRARGPDGHFSGSEYVVFDHQPEIQPGEDSPNEENQDPHTESRVSEPSVLEKPEVGKPGEPGKPTVGKTGSIRKTDSVRNTERVRKTDKQRKEMSEAHASDGNHAGSPQRRYEYPLEFEIFWLRYPSKKNMSKVDTYDEWVKLTFEEKRDAIRSLPAYADFRQSQDISVKHAVGFLKGRRWEGFIEAIDRGEYDYLPEETLPPSTWGGNKFRTWGQLVDLMAYVPGEWADYLGPRPGEPGCKMPDDLQTKCLPWFEGQSRAAA